MIERRHLTASSVSLLVVAFLFVGACSSGDHEGASATTSGGAGSDVPSAGHTGSESEGGAPSDDVPLSNGSSSSIGEGGSGSSEPGSGAGGKEEPSSAGGSNTGDAGEAPIDAGGSGGLGAGGSAAGASASGGKGGATFVEPTCAAAGSSSTSELNLPCDVYAALYVCRTCHSSPPTKPANSAIVSYSDVKSRAAAIYGVIKGEWMPPPPSKMTTSQRNTVLKWLGTEGSCAVGVPQGCH